jgi:hypothetical protein
MSKSAAPRIQSVPYSYRQVNRNKLVLLRVIADCKDWPLLKRDWVKDLCALALHRELTLAIRTAEIIPALRRGRLYERL